MTFPRKMFPFLGLSLGPETTDKKAFIMFVQFFHQGESERVYFNNIAPEAVPQNRNPWMTSDVRLL